MTLTAPNGGEVLTAGETVAVTWSSTGSIDAVGLEYSIDNAVNWSTMETAIADSGSYDWTVPETPSAACVVRVRVAADSAVFDDSDAVFSIESSGQPSITVVSPNGRESLTVGSHYDIAWTTVGDIGSVQLEYSIDGGSHWLEILLCENTGNYNWQVPDEPSEECLLRIRAGDSDEGVSDVSDAFFSIVRESGMMVTSPNGGEELIVDKSHLITWEGGYGIDEVKLEYSPDNGTTYFPIVDAADNTGYYQWQVPPHVSGGCLIRISEAGDSGIKKSSLQYSFKFALTDDGTDFENGTGFSVDFGDTGGHDVSMGCEEGVETICFDGHKAVLGRAVEFYESVHEMRVLIDMEREVLSLFIDGRQLFDTIELPRGFEIKPVVSVISSSDLEIDDISVKVLSLNEEKEELLMTLFTEEFEGYEEGVFSNQKFFRGSRGAARHGRVINPPGGGQKSPLGRRRQEPTTNWASWPRRRGTGKRQKEITGKL